MSRRLKVLLSAYACEPGRGSEPEVGWRWATSLARHHEITVITRANNRDAILQGLAGREGPMPAFIYYDLPPLFLRLKKAGLPVALYYFLWQLGARWKVRNCLDSYDLIHHVTFNSFRQPGFWWFCKQPVVLGPLGGGQACPWPFFSLMRGRRLAEAVRTLSVLLSSALPHLWLSFASARLILVANEDTQRRLPRWFRGKSIRLLETGIPEEKISKRQPIPEDETVRVLWLGWLSHIKAPELALRAFRDARERNPGLRLTMAGDGPLSAGLKSLTRSLGIADFVDWVGRVPHAEVGALLQRHQIFIFTSLRDTSGNVLLEAMAAGLPCVTLRHQGAAEMATDATAIRVSVRSIDQTVTELAEALAKLAGSAELRREMGHAGLQRVKEVYAWPRQAQQMSCWYLSLFQNSDREAF